MVILACRPTATNPTRSADDRTPPPEPHDPDAPTAEDRAWWAGWQAGWQAGWDADDATPGPGLDADLAAHWRAGREAGSDARWEDYCRAREEMDRLAVGADFDPWGERFNVAGGWGGHPDA